MKIYVGTSGYAYKEWKGIFYPEKIQPKEMLRFYSNHLGAVEINNTFYRMPTENILTSWAEQVPDNFTFAFKAPQAITHLKRLRNVKTETEYLLRTLSVLESRLGPILFQFPNSFHANLPAIKDFLMLLPRTMSCAFEFRSPSWVEAGVADILSEKGFCLCTTDSDESPPNQIIRTAPWGYLRLRRPDYTDADLAEWRTKILSQEWEKVFVFFKHEDETKGPEMALRFKELISVVPS
ncbi:MAG: hypothetical protein A4E65_02354 [Syntrophorhabdus sp. PtaU1.Bin153]|nr:MAG: hypothetical protein A4E65_02354 [Syntrophorhabdus sp. PtaU1.Bin153]